ncbi:MAG: SpaH/EbpB family LPXTG-anchored major pilin [Lachnospiraceae bacterium]
MKRFGSMLLLLFMILTLSMPAFAVDGEGQVESGGNTLVIHKTNVTKLEKQLGADSGTYEGKQADGTAILDDTIVGTYKIGNNIHNVTAGMLNQYPLDGISFTISQVEIKDTAKGGSINVDDYKSVEGGISKKGETVGGVISWTGLADGYYRVTENISDTAITSGKVDFIVKLPMSDPNKASETIKEVHVYPKNRIGEGPLIQKNEKDTVNTENGTEVKWSITADIPSSIIGSDTEQYLITDSWGSNLKYKDNSVSVYYKDVSGNNNVLLNITEDYSLTISDNNAFEIEFTKVGLGKLANAIKDNLINSEMLLHVDYSSIISITDKQWADLATETAGVTNNVQIDFTNDNGYAFKPGTDHKTPSLYQVQVTKYDGDNKKVMLKGAEFELYTTNMEKGQLVKGTKVSMDNSSELVTIVKTNTDGIAYFSGLPAGTYLMEEIVAPKGYKKLNDTYTVEVTDKTNLYGTVNVDVVNYYDNSLTLPETGGMGTIIFTIVGIGLIVIAGIILIISKKKNNSNN